MEDSTIVEIQGRTQWRDNSIYPTQPRNGMAIRRFDEPDAFYIGEVEITVGKQTVGYNFQTIEQIRIVRTALQLLENTNCLGIRR